jgi:hypothetical protein
MAYYSVEPWGPERADLNAGIIASTLANVHRDSKRRPEPFTAAEFMPKYGPEPEPEEEADGMAPETVLDVMERLLKHQEMVVKQNS